jgi:polar amino acid transport system substrate-binding protein
LRKRTCADKETRLRKAQVTRYVIREGKRQMIRIILSAALALVAQAAIAQSNAQSAPPDALKELAPTGKLRAAINFGNGVLAQKCADGTPQGISADLARELAKRLSVPLEFVAFEAAGKAFEAAKDNQVDVLFVAIEPVRAADVEFSPPYVLIEGTYLVLKDSPLKAIADVDRAGVRIAIGRGSAYDLYLTRTLKNATLVRAATGGCCAMIDQFRAEKLEAVAGVKQPLVEYAKTHSDVRVMDGRFQEIRQAMGTPKGRMAAVAYLRTFIEEMKASGFVADALKRSNQPDAQVAPAGG